MRKFGQAIARLWEALLFVVGAAFVLGSWNVWQNVLLMLLWDLIALVYLTVGALIAKISAHTGTAHRGPPRGILGARVTFVFGVMASLTGLTAAINALFDSYDDEIAVVIDVAAVAAIILAWLLMHASYAGFYGALYARRRDTGLEFPATAEPGSTDMLYFAFTIGTNLAVSDVRVTTRRMRWHVTVHSVVGFFYNAAVLATAIKLVTG